MVGEDVTERVNFYMTVPVEVEHKIIASANRIGVKPADLVEQLIEIVFTDDLVSAILDK